jgi:hypothetical protein
VRPLILARRIVIICFPVSRAGSFRAPPRHLQAAIFWRAE